ncbi:DUF2802 domain-containing protein [Methylomonas sp. AM2-LC]|uniref:DUF2802 domain-containing protein n=1 Tax=Methylomonas sp. AM2-LC TaxID=3153301 RepID=UPI003265025E
MNENLLLVIVCILLVIIAILVRLLRRYKNLKSDIKLLTDQLRRYSEDVAGLTSAALAIDQHLFKNDTHLNNLSTALNDLHSQQLIVNSPSANSAPIFSETPIESNKTAQGYENVIAKIQSGVGIDELVNVWGLTRDEAVLLSRLHGRKT